MELTNQLTDFTFLNELVGDDHAFLKEMLETYLDQLPNDLSLLIKSYAQHDYKKTGDVAHSMKSSAKFMGVTKMHSDLAKIENTCKEGHISEATSNLVSEVYEMGIAVIEELRDRLEEIS